jgi:hypothetical protein
MWFLLIVKQIQWGKFKWWTANRAGLSTKTKPLCQTVVLNDREVDFKSFRPQMIQPHFFIIIIIIVFICRLKKKYIIYFRFCNIRKEIKSWQLSIFQWNYYCEWCVLRCSRIIYVREKNHCKNNGLFKRSVKR